MTERLLQFIWQFQYFNRNELSTICGEKLQIFHPGVYNPNQGPDFTDARIQVNNNTWAGTVELHLKSSDWNRHRHESDSNYRNVILHVVWENDQPPNNIPILELQNRVSKLLLKRYEDLMESTSFIACEGNLQGVPSLRWTHWKERVLSERLLRKAAITEEYLKQNNYHWDETFWWMLARNFGMKVNADAFEAIARSIPSSFLSRQKKQVQQLEAILLGQAGLLEEEFVEEYPRQLKKEYQFQRNKLTLSPVSIPVLFLRMRPGNFPTIRLSQLAMLLHSSEHLFSRTREASTVRELRSLLNVSASEYWKEHYRLDEISPGREKKLGRQMLDNIIVNTVIPMMFTYAHYHKDNGLKSKLIQWLEDTLAEHNSITAGFEKLGLLNRNAFDSQAYIELKTHYCEKKRCLDCGIGNSILRKIK